GLNVSVTEDVQVVDLEGPSGQFTSQLVIQPSLPNDTLTIHVFHLIDGDPAGQNSLLPYAEYARAGGFGNQVRLASGSYALHERFVGTGVVRRQCGPRT